MLLLVAVERSLKVRPWEEDRLGVFQPVAVELVIVLSVEKALLRDVTEFVRGRGS